MQSIFKRYEKKYLISKEQGVVLQKLISQHMAIDRFGEYLIQDLYFDTADWDIIRKSIEKPLYKEKLRLRFYDQYSPESECFLELKKKFDGIVYKRRMAIPLKELKNRCVTEIVSSIDSQISREIGFYLQNNMVSEKIHIAYKRTAYTDLENRDLRITFDKDIFFHLGPFKKNNPDDYHLTQKQMILDQNQMVMEIKATNAMPLWLTQALSNNSIFPASFSKFGVCYTGHIYNRQCTEGVKYVV
jgi:SPX domain protein involved in polyphosphate accumulation